MILVYGLLAPAGTPPAIIDKVYRETVRVLALSEVRRNLEMFGIDTIGNSPAEFAVVIKAEIPDGRQSSRAPGSSRASSMTPESRPLFGQDHAQNQRLGAHPIRLGRWRCRPATAAQKEGAA